jgi:polyhydroxyalkanoate synthesis regulator phasin
VPDAVREAVERTVQATFGQAAQAQQQTRGRAQDARTRAQEVVDDVVKSARTTRGRAQDAVEGVVKGAEVVGERVREALEDARPATHDDIKELKRELRAIGRRLDAIEERLPAAGKPTAKKPVARRSTSARTKKT